MPSNIESTEQLNKLLQQQNQLYLAQAKLMRGQASLLSQIVEITQQVDPSKMTRGMTEFDDAVRQVAETIGDFGSESQAQFGNIEKYLSKSNRGMKTGGLEAKKYGKALIGIGIAGEALNKVAAGFNLIKNAMTGGLGIIFDVISAMGNLAVSILTIPFKMLNALISQTGGGSSELRQAIEDLRKEFGNLRTGSSKAVLDMSRAMRGQLAQTALSTWRIFGNLAERIKTLTEYAKQLGPLFTNLTKSLVANVEAFGAYVKGLGLTEEGMKGVGRQALIFGTTFQEVGRQITTIAYQLGPAFGINGKEVSRAIGDMMQDVKNFGTLSVKQLGSIAVFTRKLGLEFKDLLGIVDKFDNFEDAAQSVAQLNQAFGLNVDALEMIKEQDPAARFDKLRKAFAQTGRSVENMTRQELKLLASQTGLSEEAVKLGFSMKNQGMTYDQVQKKADLAEKKQLTQAEAMQKLASSIERLVKSGDFGTGGFFDRFIQGFIRGIQWSWPFRKMMWNIRRDLMLVFRAGIQVGRAFVEFFPGVKKVFKGIGDAFSPARWRAMLFGSGGVVSMFRTFFKDLGDPSRAKQAVQKLLGSIMRTFRSFFSGAAGAAGEVIEGFKNFFKSVISGAGQLLEQGTEGILNAFEASGKVGGQVSEAMTGFAGLLGRGIDYIRNNINWDRIFSNIKQIAEKAWQKVQEFFQSEAGQKLIKSANGLYNNIEPHLINLGLKIGQAIVKGTLKGLVSWASMLGEAWNETSEYVDQSVWDWFSKREVEREINLAEFGARLQQKRTEIERTLATGGLDPGIVLREQRRLRTVYAGLVSNIRGQIEAMTEAGNTTQANALRRQLKNVQEVQKRLVHEITVGQSQIVQQTNRGTEALQNQAKAAGTIELPEAVVKGRISASPRGRTTPGLAPGMEQRIAAARKTIADQAEAVEVLQELDRIKRLRVPTESEMKTLGQRLTAVKQGWQQNVAGSVLGLAALIKATDFAGLESAIDGIPDLNSLIEKFATINALAEISLPSQTQIKRIEKGFSSFSQSWRGNIANITTKLVDSVNQVTRDITAIAERPQQINLRLKELAGHLGMGQTKGWEIKNRTFTVKFDIDIYIDAEDLEETLINRPGSRLSTTVKVGE